MNPMHDFFGAAFDTADTLAFDSLFVWRSMDLGGGFAVLVLTERECTPIWGWCTGGLEP